MFEELYRFIYNLLIGFWAIFPYHDMGLAVIFATIVIKLIIWPVEKKGLHYRRTMQNMQPEMAKIKEKAAGDKMKEYQLVQEMNKKKGVNQLTGGCLPLFIQLPFLFGLFTVFQSWLKHPQYLSEKTYSFIHSLPYVQKTISDPSLFHPSFFGLNISLPGKTGLIFMIFPVVAAFMQYYQTKMLMPKENLDDQQKLMARMNVFFPAMVIAFGYSWPLALSLYWIALSGVGIAEQYIVVKANAEKEEKIIESTAVEVKPKALKAKKAKKKKKKR